MSLCCVSLYRVSLLIYCYAECHYASCHYAECYCAVCRIFIYLYAECHYAECRGASISTLGMMAYLFYALQASQGLNNKTFTVVIIFLH